MVDSDFVIVHLVGVDQGEGQEEAFQDASSAQGTLVPTLLLKTLPPSCLIVCALSMRPVWLQAALHPPRTVYA